MISKRTLAAIALILIPIGALAALLQAAEDPPTELYVRTNPAGAALFLDGKKLGTAPDIFEVAPGKHELLAVLEGCKSAKRDIVVPATRIERVILTLESLSSSAGDEDAAAAQVVSSAKSLLKQLQQAKDDLKAAKTIFLPCAETPGVAGVLDLASGEMLPISGEKGFSAIREFTRQHHRGDLYHGYDEEDGGAFLGCMRGATAMIWDGNRARPFRRSQKREDVTVCLLPPLPCRLLITTAEKKVFDVTILSAGKSEESDKGIPRNVSGVRLKYKRADAGIVSSAHADSVSGSAPEAKTIFLPDVETPKVGVVLDLGSGRMLPPISNRSEGLREYANLDRGDLFYDDANGGVLGCLRGAEIKVWDDDRLVTFATEQIPTIFKLPPLPCQLVIITAEKKRADVMVFAARTSKEGDVGLPNPKGVPGIILRYTLSEAAEAHGHAPPPALAKPAKTSESAKDESHEESPLESNARPHDAAGDGPKRWEVELLLPRATGKGEKCVLDLGGKTTLALGKKDPEDLTALSQLDKGDVIFTDTLVCLRGAKAMCKLEDEWYPLGVLKREQSVTKYRPLPRLPGQLVIVTADKTPYEVTIRDITEAGQVWLSYRPADPKVVPKEITPIFGVQTQFLPDLNEAFGMRSVLDLATGEMLPYPYPEDTSHFTRLGKGDVLCTGKVFGWLRGGTALQWDGEREEYVPCKKLTSADGSVASCTLPPWPCRLLITTAEGSRFDLTVLSRYGEERIVRGAPTRVNGLHLIYRPLKTTSGEADDLDLLSKEQAQRIKEQTKQAKESLAGRIESMSFDEEPLCEVLSSLSREAGVAVVIQEEAGKLIDDDARAKGFQPLSQPVTLIVRGEVTLGAVLQQVIGPIGLKYELRDGIVVVCPAKSLTETTESDESAPATDKADRILRRYAEAVWAELPGKLREADQCDASEIVATVTSDLTARHLMPHTDLLAAHFLQRLPEADPVDMSQWTEWPLKAESTKIKDLSKECQAIAWNPAALANALRRAVTHHELGVEALAKRSILEATAPTGSVTWDRSVDKPVNACKSLSSAPVGQLPLSHTRARWTSTSSC